MPRISPLLLCSSLLTMGACVRFSDLGDGGSTSDTPASSSSSGDIHTQPGEDDGGTTFGSTAVTTTIGDSTGGESAWCFARVELPGAPPLSRQADVDGDGLPELWAATVAGDPPTTELSAFEIGVDGGVAQVFEGSRSGQLAALHDVDGDGRDDALFDVGGDASSSWLAGNPDGSLGETPQALALPPTAQAEKLADANGDGIVDLFVDLAELEQLTIELWLGDGDGGFAIADSVVLPLQIGASLEVVATDAEGTFVFDYDNGAIGFGVEDTMWFVDVAADGTMTMGPRTPYFSFGAVLGGGDFDDDGQRDILARSEEQNLVLWRGTADGFVEQALPQIELGASFVELGDFRGDGTLQLLSVSQNEDGSLLEFPLVADASPIPVVGPFPQSSGAKGIVVQDPRRHILNTEYVSEDVYALSLMRLSQDCDGM